MAVGALLPALVAVVVAWQLGALLTAAGDEASPRAQAVAGALAFALAVGTGLGIAPLPPAVALPTRWILLGGALVLIAGLWRDLGRGARGQAAGAIAVAALAVMAFGGVEFARIKIPFAAPGSASPLLDLGPAGPALTVVWVVAVAMAVRALDPLPGLTAGFGTTVAATFLLVAVTRGRDDLAAVSPLTVPLASAVLGACLGLVLPGLGPRALSLGRGGAGLLGFLLGVLSVVGTLKHTAFLLLALPVLALALPVLNLWYGRRQWARAGHQDPALLGRARSLPEMLARRGFTHRRTVGLLLGLQIYCSLVALVLVGLITVPLAVKLLLLVLLLPVAFAAFFLVTRIAAQVSVTGDQKVDLLGVPVDALTYDSALARMDEFIRSGTAHHVFTADVSGIMRAREEPELMAMVRTCDLVTADGAGVLWAARIFDFPLPERVSGVDLVRRLSALAAANGYRVFLLGAAPGVAAEAAEVLQRENPGLNICGVQDGYYDDEQAVIETLRAAQPHILFVAMGIPRQERFIRKWYQELSIPVCLGVGGSFDVISGKLERAPVWMQRAGLEWLFRVIQEPKRLPRLMALPRFVSAIAVQSWRAWARGPKGQAG